MGTNNAQGNAVTRKLGMQFVQHAGAGEINIRRGGKIAGDQTDGRRPSLAQAIQDRVQHGLGIDVNQRCFGTKSDHAGQRFILRMAIQVRIGVGAGHTTKKRNMRARHPGEHQQYRGQCGEQDALKYSKKQHSDEREGCSQEIQSAHPPHTEQCRKIQQPIYRGQHYSCQHRLREIFEKAGQKEQAKRKRHGGKDKRQRSACARLVIHGRLRQSAGYRVAMPHSRCEICCADAQKLLPRVQRVSVLRCESASSRDTFDIGQEQTASGQRNYSLHVT